MAFIVAELCDSPDGNNYANNDGTIGMLIGKEEQFDSVTESKEDPIVN